MDDDAHAAHGSLEWRAPTWSWASSNFLVSFHTRREHRQLCEVVSTQCEPAGPDPYRAVSSGQIKLKGTLFSFQVDLFNSRTSTAILRIRGMEYTEGITRSGRQVGCLMTWIEDGKQSTRALVQSDIFLMPVTSHMANVGWHVRTLGIALKRIEGHLFERVGLVSANWHPWNLPHYVAAYDKAALDFEINWKERNDIPLSSAFPEFVHGAQEAVEITFI